MFICLFVFEGEKKKVLNWVGREVGGSWRSWGRGKSDQDILYKKLFFNKKRGKQNKQHKAQKKTGLLGAHVRGLAVKILSGFDSLLLGPG